MPDIEGVYSATRYDVTVRITPSKDFDLPLSGMGVSIRPDRVAITWTRAGRDGVLSEWAAESPLVSGAIVLSYGNVGTKREGGRLHTGAQPEWLRELVKQVTPVAS